MQNAEEDALILSETVLGLSGKMTHAFRGHRQVSDRMVSRNWMSLGSRLDQLVQVTDGANLADCNGFD